MRFSGKPMKPILESACEQEELCAGIARSSPKVAAILDYSHKKRSDVYFMEGHRPWLRCSDNFKESQILPIISKGDIEAIQAWVGGTQECATRISCLPSMRERLPARWRIQNSETKSSTMVTCRLLAPNPARGA